MFVFRSWKVAIRVLVCSTASAVVVTTGVAGASGDEGPSHSDGSSCRDVDIPVAAEQRIHGQFCQPPGGSDAVQVLVAGVTYDHRYWDFEHEPATYSYRRAANAAGTATLAIDRLGTGGSSRPPSTTLTASAQADAVHRAVTALRDGSATGHSFRSVLLGGHSLGSTIAIIEAATYRDVDGVMLTGIGHRFDAAQLAGLFASMHPATLDPTLGRRYPVADPGYLTTRPGTRGTYLHTPGVDPAVLAADERTKSVFSTSEVPDAATLALVSPYSRRIEAPVFLANGADDVIFCPVGTGTCTDPESLAAAEGSYYAQTACLRTAVLPGAAHDVNLAESAPEFHRMALSWADEVIGRDGDTGGCPPGGGHAQPLRAGTDAR